MKKVLTLSFLFIFLFNSIGYYALFFLREHALEEEFEESWQYSLPKDQLTLIAIPVSAQKELEWDGEKEFEYHGHYYDVVKKDVKRNGTVCYYCFDDEQESRLFEGFRKNMNAGTPGQDKENSDPLVKTMKLLAKEYVSCTFTGSRFLIELPEHKTPYLLSRVSACEKEVPSPPPDGSRFA